MGSSSMPLTLELEKLYRHDKCLECQTLDKLTQEALDNITADVAAFYSVTTCAMAIQHAGTLRVVSQWNAAGDRVPAVLELKPHGFTLFHHHIKRDLPIIIEDVKKDTRLAKDPVAAALNMEFYVGAPLILTSGARKAYVGVLAIADSNSRRSFKVGDADYLVDRAADIARVFGSTGSQTWDARQSASSD
eukprot:TRINITY_DN39082_c0_g1_i1.p1 TRINITY_DN39082_c0_g1~~TRINITY_DN39082_c0_g1_i1.p1  ORF type:complete len:209 (+),score=40.64 TRINITY_DN39082_c0_g1_i1:59-628(+)